jgi:transcriptional regulator with XRE-family HTH domain
MSVTFGEIIKQSREKMQLSQEEAAKAIEKNYGVRISTSYLSMIETGMRTNLTVNLITALLKYFQLPASIATHLFETKAYPIEYRENNKKTAFQDQPSPYCGHSQGQLIALDNLPHEARHSLCDYYEFLLSKYKISN